MALPPQPTGAVALPAGAQQAVSARYAGLASVVQPEPGFHLTLQIQLDALPVHDGTIYARAPASVVMRDVKEISHHRVDTLGLAVLKEGRVGRTKA